MIPKTNSCEVIVDAAFPATMVLRRVRSSRRRGPVDPAPRAAVLPTPTTFRHTRLLAAVRHEMQMSTKDPSGSSSTPLGTPVTSASGRFPTLSCLHRVAQRVVKASETLRDADLYHDDAPEGRHFLFLRPRDVEAAILADRQHESKPLATAARHVSRMPPFSGTNASPTVLLVAFLDAAYWRTMRLDPKRPSGSPQELAASVVNAFYTLVRASVALTGALETPEALVRTTAWAAAARALHALIDTYARAVRAGKGGPSASAGLQWQAAQLTRAKRAVAAMPSRNAMAAAKKAALTETIDAVAKDVQRWATVVRVPPKMSGTKCAPRPSSVDHGKKTEK